MRALRDMCPDSPVSMKPQRLVYSLGVMNEPDCPRWVIEMDKGVQWTV